MPTRLRLFSAASVLGLLAACGGGGGSTATAPATAAAPGTSPPAAPAAGPASAPPVNVSVVRAQRRDVAVQVEATGTVSSLAVVEIKPQLSSVVTAVHVKEGQFVAKGQPLFTLDGRADAANLARVEAQLLKDQATLADAQRQLARAQELLSKSFVSQGAVDTAQANVDAQRAAVAADKAAIEAARVQVSYSRIVAPASGRVGQINVFAGSTVSPGGAAMVSITQLDPIAVSFNLPQRNLPDALKALAEAGSGPLPAAVPAAAAPAAQAASRAASGAGVTGGGRGAPAAGPSAAPALPTGQVAAMLPEGRGLRVGRLDFVDSLVDPASGTVKVKAVFSNKDQSLWPGAYVNVSLALQSLPGAVVVPQASIVQGARGTAVFVVDDGGLAAMRPVKVLQALGTDAAVSGLKPGEKVVLDGRQNVRPGARLVERSADRPAGGGGGRAASAPGGGTAAAASGPQAGVVSRPAP
jgi:multidrug efflux pump subunit AcrA (membrane-fusion protein)